MYVVTFYSFKGGVGRSMALANVATELANKGRKVLMVDFDLEAPGLHTFDFGGCSNTKGGVVDYVEDYLKTNRSPDVARHVVRCSYEPREGGEVWLMPAGTLDDSYSSKLSKLDWHYLYEKKSGYLFVEDLKAQWQERISPDYVLIDSRTGHTDVGGICTRQLPNAVVFLSFPNEQNLAGLRKIVALVDRENEKKDGPTLPIEKHFVISNVPDLDDEDRILADRLSEFSRDLNCKDFSTIHRYNSLALLNQEIFTLKRPNTRLAQEYRALTDNIILRNPEDVDGAISFINRILADNLDLYVENPSRVLNIQNKHKDNPSIMTLISTLRERLGDYEESISLISRAIDLGEGSPFLKLRRAKLLLAVGRGENALLDVRTALESEKLGYAGVRLAINLLNIANPEYLSMVFESKAFSALEEPRLVQVIEMYLIDDASKLPIALKAFTHYIYKKKLEVPNYDMSNIESKLGLVFIAMGKFEDAMFNFSHTRPNAKSSMSTIFNYAMAEWGGTNSIPIELFRFVIDKLSEINFSESNPNLKQCISLCYWVIGDIEKAKSILNFARQDALESSGQIFSCWSYLYLSKQKFLSDIDEMRRLYNGENIKPRFMSNYDLLI